ncbi:LysR substrate-binding domain-containing protein [Phaeovulum sp.]|uniref:LysR substrate-binding domain-containing protein n=1 Tax=Phaeovulum sp. TaxID=2934796 RepID=UPI003567CE64
MQNLNRLPLRALRAVEAVARLGSLTRAAEELRVSAGAVSQQVAHAEAVIGFTLFERGPRGMITTPRAQGVCAQLTEGFSLLSQAMELAEGERDEVLTVSVSPIFAARWLIWRLPAFQAAHPGLKVRLDASLALVPPGRGGVDLCIRVGRGTWPGTSAERLIPEVIFPVCAPALAERLSSPADLRNVPIIRDAHAIFGWQDWLAPAEPKSGDLPDGPVFSDASLCLDAAISGSGVFLAFETLAVDALAHGQIVEPFSRRRATRNSKWLVTAEGRALPPPARHFRNWLKQEIQAARLGEEREG